MFSPIPSRPPVQNADWLPQAKGTLRDVMFCHVSSCGPPEMSCFVMVPRASGPVAAPARPAPRSAFFHHPGLRALPHAHISCRPASGAPGGPARPRSALPSASPGQVLSSPRTCSGVQPWFWRQLRRSVPFFTGCGRRKRSGMGPGSSPGRRLWPRDAKPSRTDVRIQQGSGAGVTKEGSSIFGILSVPFAAGSSGKRDPVSRVSRAGAGGCRRRRGSRA